MTAAPAFSAWLEDFFAAYYRQRPVNATFIGVHAYDDHLPDYSESGRAAVLDSAETLLSDLRALPPEPLSAAEQLDRELAQGFLEIQGWESRSAHFGLNNPSLLTGEAVFGVLSLLLRPFAPLEQRLESAAARLAAIPTFLDAAIGAPRSAPRAWIERARRECQGARRLLGDGVDQLLHELGISHGSLRRSASHARAAFARFDAFLTTELLPRATETYACGPETFDLLLRRAHFLEYSADELEQRALDILSSPPIAALPPEEKKPPNLIEFKTWWQAANQLAEDHRLLTVPDWPVRYVKQPAWLRESAPYFYFLPYRSPAPFDPTPVVDYFVPPSPTDLSTIKLNHVVHHGSFGHHVQNWHAARAASRIGQIAATDCASRIAMLCGGSMAEGWACYSVDLADEAGFLTPSERADQQRTRLRIAARAVVDVRLHQARISLEDAAAFYRDRVGMPPDAALAEATKNSLFPATACMYLVGWEGLWRLRRANSLPLREFHDRLLAFGSVPVSLLLRQPQDERNPSTSAHGEPGEPLLAHS